MELGTTHLYNSNLETTPQGEVLQKIIIKDGFAANIIETYNNEIEVTIKNIILNTKPIKTRDGTVKFTSVKFDKPETEFSGKPIPLIPRTARERNIPYFGKITATLMHTPDALGFYPNGKPIENTAPIETSVLEIGSIPIMLGSNLCHLSGKTPEQKIEMGECFNDILGYFIINSERTIINQENLRISTFLIYKEESHKITSIKDTVAGKITCPTPEGTTVTGIVINKLKVLSVSLHHLYKIPEPVMPPIFAIFGVLGMDMETATKLILSFIDEKYHVEAQYRLEPTKAAYEALISGDESKENISKRLLFYKQKLDKSSNATLESVEADILRDLLSNISGRDNKLLHLAMYASRMIECMMDIRKLDDRDSFGNKRIQTPGKWISSLFRKYWNSVIDRKFRATSLEKKTLQTVINLYPQNRCRETFIKSFGPNAWGLMRSHQKENVTESLRRATPIDIYSQIGRINTPASRQSKNPALRMPHPSQISYACLFETPEGEGVGLIKNLACTAYVTLEHDTELVMNVINNVPESKKCMFKERDDYSLLPLLVNGEIVAWCIPEYAIYILKFYKRSGYLKKDTSIVYNKKDRCVEVYCDGGRLARPLFIVDIKNESDYSDSKDESGNDIYDIEEGQLVIDKKKMWNASIDDLIKSGCIEYVDAREQEWLQVGETVDYVRDRYKLKKKLYLHSLAKAGDSDGELLNKEEYESVKLEYDNLMKCTHCEIDPTSIFSLAGNLVPQANRQDGPRTSFQIGMSRQALTQYHANEALRFDASYKMVYYPTKPLFQTDLQDTAGLNLMSNGQTLHVAIMAHPDNPEDGIILKEEAVKYGNRFNLCKKQTVIVSAINESTYTERFSKPLMKADTVAGRYHAINDRGIPRIDAEIKVKDCIVCKVREHNKNSTTANAGTIEDIPVFAGVGQEGFVDRVLITTQPMQKRTIVKVKLRQNREYIPGDKLACLSPDHLVLTQNREWVAIDEVLPSDKLATLNKNDKVEYHNPKVIHHYSANGETMYKIKNEHISTLVTTNHRMHYSVDRKYWNLLEINDLVHLAYFYVKCLDDSNLTNIVKVTPDTDIRTFKCESTVHCVTIQNEVFLVKRNGKMYWTGNSRYSQKGTVSKMLPAREMPRVASGPLKGMTPDIIINPHGQPSRMTINMMIEILVNKAACIDGKYLNATTFRDFSEEIEHAQNLLEEYGLDRNGKEEFELPNGKKLKSKIYFGPCFYQALKHHVVDKIQMRGRGEVKPSTRQPVSGRSNQGGLKIGEMERDAFCSFSSSFLALERLCLASDAYNLPVCGTCGTIAITNYVDNIIKCNICGPKAHVGVIRIPYVLKLLYHYLVACGIQMSFKTKEIISANSRIEERFLH